MTVTVFPEVMQDMAESAYRQQVYIVAETQMHLAPWLFDDEGWEKSRLKAAIELVCTGKVTQTLDGWHVEGSSREGYDLPGATLACPCKAAAHNRKTSVCKHRVAVELARRVQQAYPQDTPLPFGPVTVDERLAQSVALGTLHDTTAFQTSHTPQEDRMPEDESKYIPEPESVSTAVLEPPVGMPPADVKIPREFTVNIKGKVHVLYTGLVVAARANGLVTLSADWTYNDAELSLAHAVCTFADGRRYEESGDATPGNVTKGISLHFRRVALTRAKARCLRDALGISECSVEEMEDDGGKRETPVMTPNPLHPVAELRQRIWTKVQQLAPEAKTREAVEAFIKARTGMDLHPDLYGAILGRLQEGA